MMKSKYQWLLIPLLLLVTWLGVRGLAADALWIDELRSLRRAGAEQFMPPDSVFTPALVWERTINARYQVPGYYLLLAGWGRFVGLSDYGGRALSLLLGVLSTAAIFRLGRDWHSPLVGFGAALTLGTGAFYVNYLHDMRAYTLLVLLTICVLWCYWRTIYRAGGRMILAGLFLSATAALYTHYAAAILLGTLSLYHLLIAPKNRRWIIVLIVFGMIGISFMPWLPNLEYTLSFAQSDPRQERALTAPETLQQIATMFSNGGQWLLVLLGVLALRERGKAARLSWFLLLIGLGATLMLNSRVPFIFDLRYLIIFWVPLALIVGLGIASLQIRPALLLSVWLLGSLWSNFDPAFADRIHDPIYHPPYDALANSLASQAETDDFLLMIADETNAERGGYTDLLPLYIESPPHAFIQVEPDMSEQFFRERVQAWVAGKPVRVWLTFNPNYAWGQGWAADTLRTLGYAHCETPLVTRSLQAELFGRLPATNAILFQKENTTITLALLQPLDSLLTLGWQLGNDVPDYEFSYAVHFFDANDQRVAQIDQPLFGRSFNCQSLPLPTLPAGSYRAELLVYAWQTGDRLQLAETDQEAITLGQFHIP